MTKPRSIALAVVLIALLEGPLATASPGDSDASDPNYVSPSFLEFAMGEGFVLYKRVMTSGCPAEFREVWDADYERLRKVTGDFDRAIAEFESKKTELLKDRVWFGVGPVAHSDDARRLTDRLQGVATAAGLIGNLADLFATGGQGGTVYKYVRDQVKEGIDKSEPYVRAYDAYEFSNQARAGKPAKAVYHWARYMKLVPPPIKPLTDLINDYDSWVEKRKEFGAYRTALESALDQLDGQILGVKRHVTRWQARFRENSEAGIRDFCDFPESLVAQDDFVTLDFDDDSIVCIPVRDNDFNKDVTPDRVRISSVDPDSRAAGTARNGPGGTCIRYEKPKFWTPPATDRFEYEISDENGRTARANVTIGIVQCRYQTALDPSHGIDYCREKRAPDMRGASLSGSEAPNESDDGGGLQLPRDTRSSPGEAGFQGDDFLTDEEIARIGRPDAQDSSGGYAEGGTESNSADEPDAGVRDRGLPAGSASSRTSGSDRRAAPQQEGGSSASCSDGDGCVNSSSTSGATSGGASSGGSSGAAAAVDPSKDASGRECSYFTRPAVERNSSLGVDSIRLNYYEDDASVCHGTFRYRCKRGRWVRLGLDCGPDDPSQAWRIEGTEQAASDSVAEYDPGNSLDSIDVSGDAASKAIQHAGNTTAKWEQQRAERDRLADAMQSQAIAEGAAGIAQALSQAASSSGSGASGQGCTPLPPRCADASGRGERFLQELPQRTGISDLGGQAYCALLIGIESSEICAGEFRKAGRTSCAAAVDQQINELRQSLASAEQSSSPAVVSRARQVCSSR